MLDPLIKMKEILKVTLDYTTLESNVIFDELVYKDLKLKPKMLNSPIKEGKNC